ncbi:hypothetical protein V5F38_05060 [Xanthobacter sp. V0B-10]|uniref:hypothetical protein n=1 Tax=Xanthobacter albus TaxID=3119929 RepID=UPI0037293B9D
MPRTWMIAAAIAVLPMFWPQAGRAEGPEIRGTWSTSCPSLPALETLHFDATSVQVADRHCQFVSWKQTSVGWHSPVACSTEGHVNTGQILLVMKSATQILIDFDGLNGTFTKCTAPAPRTGLSARLEGVWARDRKACQLYSSGSLDNPALNMHTLRGFGVVEFRSGRLDIKYQAAQCQFTRSEPAKAGEYKFGATCEVKGQSGDESGIVSFKDDDRVHIQFTRGMLSAFDLTKCTQ